MAAISRRQALASAGAVIVAGGASCAPIPALAARDPLLDALEAYKAVIPELNPAGVAAINAKTAAEAAYPERPRWPLRGGGTGGYLPQTVEEFDAVKASALPRVTAEQEAGARAAIEAWQAECRAADIAHGVPEADARMKAVEARLYGLYDAMTETPAATIAGLVARLEFLRDHQRGDDPTTLDAALEDARRLGGVA